MKNTNGLIILFLLAFAAGIFAFITGIFSKEKDSIVPEYRVEVKEIVNRL